MPAVWRIVVTVTSRSTSASTFWTPSMSGRVLEGLLDCVEVRGSVSLMLDRGPQRVQIEIAGEVLATLGQLGLSEAVERFGAGDVLDIQRLGHRVQGRDEVVDLALRDVLIEERADLEVVLDSVEARDEERLDRPEPREQQEHQHHRRGGGQRHQPVAPEALPGATDAERRTGIAPLQSSR